MNLDVQKFAKVTKADVISFIQLLLNALNTINSGARFDYKIGDVVLAGQDLEYGVYAQKAGTPAAAPVRTFGKAAAPAEASLMSLAQALAIVLAQAGVHADAVGEEGESASDEQSEWLAGKS